MAGRCFITHLEILSGTRERARSSKGTGPPTQNAYASLDSSAASSAG